MLQKKDFINGLKSGFPIFLGYLPVSFTFGFMAVSGGFPVWLAVLMSITNLTSAGQFAGTNLIIAGAGYIEIGMTTFIINLRYMLMSVALSQKINPEIPIWKRLIFSFGITDETFVVASTKNNNLSASYLVGLIFLPFIGWSTGTFLGGSISSFLPVALQNAMGIGLYAMFIAIIIPAARESKQVLFIVILAIIITCILKYVPLFAIISSGFRIIIATILSAGIGAWLYPKTYDDEISEKERS